jgi:hypothetical protein
VGKEAPDDQDQTGQDDQEHGGPAKAALHLGNRTTDDEGGW